MLMHTHYDKYSTLASNNMVIFLLATFKTCLNFEDRYLYTYIRDMLKIVISFCFDMEILYSTITRLSNQTE